ncbi:MAG TPA: hypothetical protein VHK66_05820 [Microvirga sp.]|nr:hypothetical protein [Microvirga sp.]
MARGSIVGRTHAPLCRYEIAGVADIDRAPAIGVSVLERRT